MLKESIQRALARLVVVCKENKMRLCFSLFDLQLYRAEHSQHRGNLCAQTPLTWPAIGENVRANLHLPNEGQDFKWHMDFWLEQLKESGTDSDSLLYGNEGESGCAYCSEHVSDLSSLPWDRPDEGSDSDSDFEDRSDDQLRQQFEEHRDELKWMPPQHRQTYRDLHHLSGSKGLRSCDLLCCTASICRVHQGVIEGWRTENTRCL